MQNWKNKAKANDLTFDDFLKTLDKKDYFKYLKYCKDKKIPYYPGMTIIKQDLLNELSPDAQQLGNETLLKLKNQRTPIDQLSRKAYKQAQKKHDLRIESFSKPNEFFPNQDMTFWNKHRARYKKTIRMIF